MGEERFGRRATTLLLLLVYLAVAAGCLYYFVIFLIVPVITFVRSILPNALPIEVNVITVLYISAFVAAAILVFPAIRFFWQQRRIPQRVIDGLATLRSTAIQQILNGKVSTDVELKLWETKEEDWQQDVLAVLRRHFPQAEVLVLNTLELYSKSVFPMPLIMNTLFDS